MNAKLTLVVTLVVLTSLLLATPASADVYRKTYYNANLGAEGATYGFVRSETPIHARATSFLLSAQGSILSVNKTETTGFDVGPGFSIYTGKKLSEISSITAMANPDTFMLSGAATFSLNLWLNTNPSDDTPANGPFFVWSDGLFLGLGGDKYCLGGAGASGTSPILTVDNSTTFFLIPDGTSIAFSALKTTYPNAEVAIWVGIYIPGGTTGSGFAVIPTSMVSVD